MSSLVHRLVIFGLLACVIWVVAVAACIEVRNAAAGFYLPRHGEDVGKWRISPGGSPRDSLRRLVGVLGPVQYIVASFLLILGLVYSRLGNTPGARQIAVASALVGLLALGLALYRGYLSSLDYQSASAPGPNQATPVNAPTASRFQAERPSRRVPEQRRSA